MFDWQNSVSSDLRPKLIIQKTIKKIGLWTKIIHEEEYRQEVKDPDVYLCNAADGDVADVTDC